MTVVHPAEHPDPEVQQALVRLNDALCQWERSTGRASALILIDGDFTMRCVSGIPSHIDDITNGAFLTIGRGRLLDAVRSLGYRDVHLDD